jgi:8-oxo-dGTP diphosphatase
MKCRPSAIIVQNDCLLTMRYVYGDKEVFALPGGNPDPNECLTTTLARELMEEMGISVEIGELAVCGEVLWADLKRDTLHMVYLSRIIGGIPELNPNETTAVEIVWLPVSVIDQTLLYPNVGKHIQAYLNSGNRSPYVGVIDQPYLQ